MRAFLDFQEIKKLSKIANKICKNLKIKPTGIFLSINEVIIFSIFSNNNVEKTLKENSFLLIEERKRENYISKVYKKENKEDIEVFLILFTS
ncbi:MAG: hypothetical protein DRP29_06260 [Thermodesulfobacteriota bacterium]|nr:MAG: hypothetical protein DRP29_06260 [Thermodesulfobacteriota bacterium]